MFTFSTLTGFDSRKKKRQQNRQFLKIPINIVRPCDDGERLQFIFRERQEQVFSLQQRRLDFHVRDWKIDCCAHEEKLHFAIDPDIFVTCLVIASWRSVRSFFPLL